MQGAVMLTYKLVHLIQYHSDTLAASLLSQVQISERAGSYESVSPEELKECVHEIYLHLGTWLLQKSETDIEQRYLAIGARRAEQGIPLSELVWVIVLTKHNLSRFIEDASVPGRVADTSEKQELLQLLDQFFDLAIHAAVVGYERDAQNRRALPKSVTSIGNKIRNKVRNKTRKAS
jgi:hypothetical protein